MPEPMTEKTGSMLYLEAEGRSIGNISSVSSAVLITLAVIVFSLSSDSSNYSVATPAVRTTISTRSSTATLATKVLTES